MRAVEGGTAARPVTAWGQAQYRPLARIPPAAGGVVQKGPVYGPFLSGADRNRTDDLLVANQALSRLSYGPMAPPILR